MISLAPGEPKQKAKRTNNPNRAPPSSRGNNKKPKNATQSSRSAASAGPNGEPTEWEVRMTKQAEMFDKSRPENIEKFFETFPARLALRESIDSSVRHVYQAGVDAQIQTECADHCCCLGMAEADIIALLPVEKLRNVVVVHFGSTFVLQVPNHRCKGCGSVVTVHPFAVDCAPTTPTEHCETWITLTVSQFFEDVYLTNGLSADAFLHALTNLEKQYTPSGSKLMAGEEEMRAGRPKAQDLVTAVFEYGKVHSAVSDIDELSEDPLKNCFVCAETIRAELSNGTKVPSPRVAVMADGMNGCNLFASAGSKQKKIPHSTNTFFGHPAESILEKHEANELGRESRSLAESAAEREEAEEDGRIYAACTSALSCNREVSSNSRADLQYHGAVAVVCAHVIPAERCAIAMPGPEQHIFYTAAFKELYTKRPDVCEAYLDVMCRYHLQFYNMLQELVDLGVLPRNVVQDVKALLPWMHAFDHDLSCQLKFSGLYQAGVGRRVGEQTESWWSLVKSFAKKARYMSPRNWWDGFNRLYTLLSSHKQYGFPRMMEKKILRIEQKLVSCTKDLESVRADAAAHGVADLDAALLLVQQAEQAGSTDMDPDARLVEVMLKLDCQNSLALHLAAFPLQLKGNSGIHLHSTVKDGDKTKARLNRILAQLLEELDVELGTLPSEDSALYKGGLEKLRISILQRFQRQVEDQVFKRKLIQQDLDHVVSKKNAVKDKKRLQSNRNTIKNLLEIISTWRTCNTGQQRVGVTNETLTAVCSGAFPWREIEVGENGSESAQRHFGMQYRTAINQLKRTEEEKTILSDEVVRLVNRLEELMAETCQKIELCNKRVENCAEGADQEAGTFLDRGAAAGLRRDCKRAAGRAALLGCELERLRCIFNESLERLRDHAAGPLPDLS